MVQVQAQVLRCTDSQTGQVTYTDGACASSSQVYEVERRKTPEERQEEQRQAQAALALQRERRQMDEQRRQQAFEQERVAREQALREQLDHTQSSACVRSRRQLHQALGQSGVGDSGAAPERLQLLQRQMEFDCLGPGRYVDMERARPLAYPPTYPPHYPPPPAVKPPVVVVPRPAAITHCNVFRCYDSAGGVHPRN